MLSLAVATSAAPASAPPASKTLEDLSSCLVSSTTDADRSLLVQWIFSMLAQHPDVKPIASVSDSVRGGLNRATADLVMRLVTVSCRAEARAAVQAQGVNGLQPAFSILGQVAAQQLFSHQAVMAGMSDWARLLDRPKLQEALSPEDH